MQTRICVHMLQTCIRKLYACVCIHGHAYACLGSRNYERQVFCIWSWDLEWISHRLGAIPNPNFFQYKKPYMVPFQNTLKILRENLKVTRNSESKREMFTKHPQVNFLLIETFSSLDLWVLKFTNQFCLIVNGFD